MSRSDRRRAGDCAAATILCLGILLWEPSPPLNLAAAAPLVFYLPGWAVLHALKAEPEGWLESAALRVTLSVAIVVIAGLLLHLADSITRPGWLGSLGVITCAACLFSLATGRRSAAARPSEPTHARWAGFRIVDISMMALAIALTGGAVVLTAAVTGHYREFYYTQLWIVPKQDAPEEVVVGLHSAEAGDTSYAVELLVDRHLVKSWSDVSLKQGETWTTAFRWAGFGEVPRPVQPLKESASRQEAPKATVSERVSLGAMPRVEALVYKLNDRSVVYRHVWTAPQCATGETAHGRPSCVF